jgi:hypothetical protein
MLEKIKEHALSIRPTFRYSCKIGDVEEVQKYLDEGYDCTEQNNKAIIVASKKWVFGTCSFTFRA